MEIQSILSDLRISFQSEGNHHCRPGWVQIDCVYCGAGSGKYHMGISLYGGFVNCWQCGRHNLRKVLTLASGVSEKQVGLLLKDIQFDRSFVKSPVSGKLVVPKGVGPLLTAHRRYLKRRNYDPQELEVLWNVQGLGPFCKLKWRLYLPIIHKGQEVSWTTRKLNDDGLRYLSAKPEEEAISHKKLIYGEDYCRHSIIVVEGPFDAWRVGPGAGGLLGTGFTMSQVLRISRYPIRAICLDNSVAAQRRASELCDLLEGFPGKTYRVELEAEDPDSAKPKEIRALRKAFLK